MNRTGKYDVELHHKVQADLAEMPRNVADKLLRTIEKRLWEHPEAYGFRLRRSLRGYWKLRVGDYRVVFEITGCKVRVYGVMHRREVCRHIARRLTQEYGPGEPKDQA